MVSARSLCLTRTLCRKASILARVWFLLSCLAVWASSSVARVLATSLCCRTFVDPQLGGFKSDGSGISCAPALGSGKGPSRNGWPEMGLIPFLNCLKLNAFPLCLGGGPGHGAAKETANTRAYPAHTLHHTTSSERKRTWPAPPTLLLPSSSVILALALSAQRTAADPLHFNGANFLLCSVNWRQSRQRHLLSTQ